MTTFSEQDREKLPKHVAIIMDGNGRWARSRGKPRIFGHRNGVKNVRSVVNAAREFNVPFVTLYAFSTENQHRPEDEKSGLMRYSALIKTRINSKSLNTSTVNLR